MPSLPHSRRNSCARFPLSEVMDDGYPQVLNSEALKLYITQEGVRSELAPTDIRVRLC